MQTKFNIAKFEEKLAELGLDMSEDATYNFQMDHLKTEANGMDNDGQNEIAFISAPKNELAVIAIVDACNRALQTQHAKLHEETSRLKNEQNQELNNKNDEAKEKIESNLNDDLKEQVKSAPSLPKKFGAIRKVVLDAVKGLEMTKDAEVIFNEWRRANKYAIRQGEDFDLQVLANALIAEFPQPLTINAVGEAPKFTIEDDGLHYEAEVWLEMPALSKEEREEASNQLMKEQRDYDDQILEIANIIADKNYLNWIDQDQGVPMIKEGVHNEANVFAASCADQLPGRRPDSGGADISETQQKQDVIDDLSTQITQCLIDKVDILNVADTTPTNRGNFVSQQPAAPALTPVSAQDEEAQDLDLQAALLQSQLDSAARADASTAQSETPAAPTSALAPISFDASGIPIAPPAPAFVLAAGNPRMVTTSADDIVESAQTNKWNAAQATKTIGVPVASGLATGGAVAAVFITTATLPMAAAIVVAVGAAILTAGVIALIMRQVDQKQNELVA